MHVTNMKAVNLHSFSSRPIYKLQILFGNKTPLIIRNYQHVGAPKILSKFPIFRSLRQLSEYKPEEAILIISP